MPYVISERLTFLITHPEEMRKEEQKKEEGGRIEELRREIRFEQQSRYQRAVMRSEGEINCKAHPPRFLDQGSYYFRSVLCFAKDPMREKQSCEFKSVSGLIGKAWLIHFFFPSDLSVMCESFQFTN